MADSSDSSSDNSSDRKSPGPTATVALREVVDQIDSQDAETTIYLNRRRGRFIRISDLVPDLFEEDWEEEDRPLVEDDDREALWEALESDRYVPLPSQFDVHEWSIMERFCRSLDPGPLRDELWRAIHGRGAFRVFKDSLHRHGLRDDWYAFLQRELEEIAIAWLEENRIPYTRD